ncbi:hypothetical protein ABZ235_17940 [Streptomyces canus]|uniref:hypothetical protein n=1 Tax=Streptomyces canus TaxID=58343 RepID=UPI0033A1A900
MARGTDSAVAAGRWGDARGLVGRRRGLLAQFLAPLDGRAHAGPAALPAQHPADAGERELTTPPSPPGVT